MMRNTIKPRLHQRLRQRFRTRRYGALVLCTCLASAAAVAQGDCPPMPADPDEILGAVDQRIQKLENKETLKRAVRNQLCTHDNIFAFLTGEAGYSYGQCFIPEHLSDAFWDSDHAKSKSMLTRFRKDCIRWAEMRYQPLIARAEAVVRQRTETQRAVKLKQHTEQQRSRAVADAQQLVGRTSQLELSRKQAIQDAMVMVQDTLHNTGLQWSADATAEQQPNGELAAWLLAADLLGVDTNTRLQTEHTEQHLNSLLGKPSVVAITATGDEDEYRVQIQSEQQNIAVDAFVHSEQPPTNEATSWVLFEHRNALLIPVAAVIQTTQQVLTAERLTGGELQVKPLPLRSATRLPTSDGPLHIQLRCVPQGGGQPMPLGSCLKPDGEISVLSQMTQKQIRYNTLPRKQRSYQVTVRAPFALLVRTGEANRRGELGLKIIDTSQTKEPELFDSRAVARHDSLFVYSE